MDVTHIDRAVNAWVQRLSEKFGVPAEHLAPVIGAEEINNRLTQYPLVKVELTRSEINLDALGNALAKCWSVGGRFDAIRLNRFLSYSSISRRAVEGLVVDFPDNADSARTRIETFIQAAVELGYRTPSSSSDWAGAALLASVLLTCTFPHRFVDFRQARWRNFIGGIGLSVPFGVSDSYGAKLVSTGAFAAAMASTHSFRSYWGKEYPLWVLAGLSWTGHNPDLRFASLLDVNEPKSFQEGEERFQIHLVRERNQAVVTKAKTTREQKDPLLKCDVCGFSFVDTYGKIGKGYIEAHHIIPLYELSGIVETSVNDLALVCSNCHRMLHRGDRLMTIEELKASLSEQFVSDF